MADKNKQTSEDQAQDQAMQALRTFEHILEIMPDDQGTLEAVILAAEQCNEHEKALTHRIHLVDVLLAQDDADSAESHIDLLREDEDPRARSWVGAHDLSARGAIKVSPVLDKSVLTPGAAPSSGLLSEQAADISGEIELAWKLMEHEQITQEEYASLVRDLTEMSATRRLEAVSLLHVLESSHHKNLDKVIAFIAQSSRTPYISLASFAMRAELQPLLPDDFIMHHGALIFEMMGRELLVAVLNPFNLETRRQVEAKTKRICHYYLARPSEFEEARKRLSEITTET